MSKNTDLARSYDLKSPLASPTFTGTVSGISKAMVGLSSVDNTTDAAKPVSTAQATAIALKANLASPTFTGTVVLPSTTSIGTVSNTELGYLDGVTSAIQTQIGTKANLASPALTGTPTAPTAAVGTNTTQIATTEFVTTQTKPVVTYMSKSGCNSQAIIVDGELYQASGTAESYGAMTTGVYSNTAGAKCGVMNGWTNIRYSSTSPIKKAGGFMHAYAFILTEAGELFTFGQNSDGQCGLGHSGGVISPTLAATGVLDVYTHPSQGEYSVDNNRLFILKADGLYAAGQNSNGQLGINNTTVTKTFTKCTGVTNTSSSYFLQVFPIANFGSNWILTSDKKLWVSGYNGFGSHGTSDTTQHNQFVDVTAKWVTSGKTLSSIKVTGGSRYYDGGDSGSKDFVVILLKYTDNTSEVKTAGYNGWSSLGDGTTTNRTAPILPTGLPRDGTVIDIAAFGSSPATVQALLSNGSLYAWGHNPYGQVGDGTTTNRATPAVVTTGVTKLFSDGMTSATHGYYVQSFVQKATGLYMCGINDSNFYAGMGVQATSNVLSYAKVLLPDNDNNVVDMGHFTTNSYGRILLALTSKGNVYTWGYNGQNGIHTDNTFSVPVPQPITIPRRLK